LNSASSIASGWGHHFDFVELFSEDFRPGWDGMETWPF